MQTYPKICKNKNCPLPGGKFEASKRNGKYCSPKCFKEGNKSPWKSGYDGKLLHNKKLR
jgi:hypothetical protein